MVAIIIPTYMVGIWVEGDYIYETACQYRHYYDYEDVHVDLSHVQDLLYSYFRCTLSFKSKPLCHLTFGG